MKVKCIGAFKINNAFGKELSFSKRDTAHLELVFPFIQNILMIHGINDSTYIHTHYNMLNRYPEMITQLQFKILQAYLHVSDKKTRQGLTKSWESDHFDQAAIKII